MKAFSALITLYLLLMPVSATFASSEGGGDSVPQALPNVISLLIEFCGDDPHHPHHPVLQFLHHYELTIFSSLIGIGLIVFFAKVRKRLQMVPDRLQSFAELLIEGLYDFFAEIYGSHAKVRRHIPFLGTLFIYIWCNNMLGLVPGGHAPTGGTLPSALNTTAALAIVVFFYVQINGLRELGILGYLDHLIGSPRDVIGWCLVPLMAPLHIMEEFIKPMSLALRLFGNITGEDALIAAFTFVGVTSIWFVAHGVVGIPLQIPFIFLALLCGTIQAVVFTLLSSIYILMMSHHEEHGEHGEEGHAAEAH